MISSGFKAPLPHDSTERAAGARPWRRTRWWGLFPPLRGSPASAREKNADESRGSLQSGQQSTGARQHGAGVREGDAGRMRSSGLSDSWTPAGVRRKRRHGRLLRAQADHRRGRGGTGSQLWALKLGRVLNRKYGYGRQQREDGLRNQEDG